MRMMQIDPHALTRLHETHGKLCLPLDAEGIVEIGVTHHQALRAMNHRRFSGQPCGFPGTQGEAPILWKVLVASGKVGDRSGSACPERTQTRLRGFEERGSQTEGVALIHQLFCNLMVVALHDISVPHLNQLLGPGQLGGLHGHLGQVCFTWLLGEFQILAVGRDGRHEDMDPQSAFLVLHIAKGVLSFRGPSIGIFEEIISHGKGCLLLQNHGRVLQIVTYPGSQRKACVLWIVLIHAPVVGQGAFSVKPKRVLLGLCRLEEYRTQVISKHTVHKHQGMLLVAPPLLVVLADVHDGVAKGLLRSVQFLRGDIFRHRPVAVVLVRSRCEVQVDSQVSLFVAEVAEGVLQGAFVAGDRISEETVAHG
mmetsp:Transcript_1886/g.4449  ORF Transcript_1886/g.4449 Transcript_1886/m.4449 type:complete len:366 (-) Transcript_1886:285-1382(-)